MYVERYMNHKNGSLLIHASTIRASPNPPESAQPIGRDVMSPFRREYLRPQGPAARNSLARIQVSDTMKNNSKSSGVAVAPFMGKLAIIPGLLENKACCIGPP